MPDGRQRERDRYIGRNTHGASPTHLHLLALLLLTISTLAAALTLA
jgi:hypothetical protein